MMNLGDIIIPFTYIVLFVIFVARNEHRLTKIETNIDWLIGAYNKKREAATKKRK